MNKNCHNSRTSNDTDLNLDQYVTFKRKTLQHQKKFDDEVMLENYDVIATFLIDGQFGAIWKPNSGTWSVKLLFSLVVVFCLIKTENKTKTSLTQLSCHCFE